MKSYLAGAVLLSAVSWEELYCREALCVEFPGISWPHVKSYLYLAEAGLMRRATRQELYCRNCRMESPGRNWPYVKSCLAKAELM